MSDGIGSDGTVYYNLAFYAQSCSKCPAQITWAEVSRGFGKDRRRPRATKLRFKQCCVCARDEHHRGEMKRWRKRRHDEMTERIIEHRRRLQ